MKIKPLNIGLALAIGMLSTGVFANEILTPPMPIAPPIRTSVEGLDTIHQINMDIPITRAEFMITIIEANEGKLPMIMDTHYALPAMERAGALGIIDLNTYPMETWSELMPTKEKEEVLLKAEQNEAIEMKKVYDALAHTLISSITVNDRPVTLGNRGIIQFNGEVMLPLKPVAKEMGFNISWDAKTSTATLNNGKIKSNVELGLDLYNYSSVNAIGMSAPFSAGIEPRLIDGSMYVSYKYFSMFADETPGYNNINFTTK
ncbi:MAG: stalk domain-containing protein [Cellulosilyticaceae bacterium]